MRAERDDTEAMLDSVLLLCLWSRVQAQQSEHRSNSEQPYVGDRLKLAKLAFLATYDLFITNTRAINLSFKRDWWGPFTKELNTNWRQLERAGLMVEEEMFTVTDEGSELAQSFFAEVLDTNENSNIAQTLDFVASEYGPLDTDPLLREIYSKRCSTLSHSRLRPISRIPRGEVFTAPLAAEEAISSLAVPEDWMETLTIVLSPGALRAIQEGLEDARAGRFAELAHSR